MKARRLRLLAAAAALAGVAAIVAAGLVLASDEPALEGSAPGTAGDTPAAGPRAPDLRGRDPVTGETVSLAAFEGKPVVVNVWASWCPGCNEEAAALRRLAAEHPEAAVLGLNFQDTVEGARQFYERWDWEHPSIFDPEGELAARLGLVGMPTTYFLDRRHRLVTSIVGATTLDGFEDGLAQAKRAS